MGTAQGLINVTLNFCYDATSIVKGKRLLLAAPPLDTQEPTSLYELPSWRDYSYAPEPPPNVVDFVEPPLISLLRAAAAGSSYARLCNSSCPDLDRRHETGLRDRSGQAWVEDSQPAAT